MLTSLLVFFVVGLVVLVAMLVVVSVLVSVTFGVAGFLVFKVAPVILIGYLIVRFLRPRRSRIAAYDREWLEG